jgi:hypothetical protein
MAVYVIIADSSYLSLSIIALTKIANKTNIGIMIKNDK